MFGLFRRRQFRQVGVELLGVEKPQADIELISVGHLYLAELGLAKAVKLELNSLGDGESRDAYRRTLVSYLEGHRDKLSEDSLDRLSRNPLRVLDSKDPADREIVADAPRLADSLNPVSKEFFNDVTAGLDDLGITYRLNPRLVRGLDYYCHTAFEFTTTELGAQGTVLAGGRYDGLIGQMGGAATPGIGWAAGVERLSMLIDDGVPTTAPIAIIPSGNAAEHRAMVLAEELRRAGFSVDLGYSGNMKKRLKRANAANACAAILIGEDELAANTGTVRDMDTGEQSDVPLDQMAQSLARYR